MKKIYCLNAISSKGTALLNEEYELTENMKEAAGVLVRSASMHEMELPDDLLAVARAGAGVNNIPLDAVSYTHLRGKPAAVGKQRGRIRDRAAAKA